MGSTDDASTDRHYGPSGVKTATPPNPAATLSPLERARPIPRRRTLVRRARLAISGAFAGLLGLMPHLLHHAGPLAGAALFAGVGGSLLFGALGFVVAIPFLVRMRRRHGSWRLPVAALALFAALFAVSTFVVGPALTGEDENGTRRSDGPAAPARPAAPAGHEAHH